MRTLLLVLVVALVLYLVRRRLKLAVFLVLASMLSLSAWRVLHERDRADLFQEVGLSLALLLAIWGLLWAASKALERRRAPPRQRP